MDISIYVLVDTVTVLLSVILAFMSLANGGYKLRINRFYVAMSLALSLWLLSNHVGNNLLSSREVAIFANYFVFGCSLTVSVLGLKILAILGDVKIFDKSRIYNFVAGLLIIISFTPMVGEDIIRQEYINGVVFGPLGDVYGLALIINTIFTLLVIIIGLKKSNNIRRKQLVSIGYSMLIALPVVALFAYILPVVTGNFYFTEFGSTPMFIVVAATYFAVIRHQLFDIRQATMRTVGYALTVVTMAGIYVALAYAVSLLFFRGQVVEGISFSPLNIALALVLAFIFQPIKKFFDKITNKIFYRNEYDSSTFFTEFGRILSHDTDLKLLLREANQYLASNMKAEYALFYLFNRGVFGNGHAKKFDITKKEIALLTDYIQPRLVNSEAVISEAVEVSEVRDMLNRHTVKVFMPLMVKKEIFGYLFFGEHKSRGYSRRDLMVLSSVANELNIAIQNSMSVEEIREFNATLQQNIDEATNELRAKNRQLQRLDEVKDEFLSIASHQLRTPLTSIKGYVDMMLEGDFGPVSKEQREVLNDVFTSSERMVQLINDFLNVSRIQTGKFSLERRPTDLEELIEKEIKLMSASLEQRDLKIDWRCDEVMPLLNIDADKVRQVVVNMIDNAIYYSRPGTVIKVELVKTKDNLVFTVTDTGIGVPIKEQANLFGKFFRASNARKRRPDGTGVGLYLAKKIIDNHGGEVIFESTEGKGSTFGFKLPLVA